MRVMDDPDPGVHDASRNRRGGGRYGRRRGRHGRGRARAEIG